MPFVRSTLLGMIRYVDHERRAMVLVDAHPGPTFHCSVSINGQSAIEKDARAIIIESGAVTAEALQTALVEYTGHATHFIMHRHHHTEPNP